MFATKITIYKHRAAKIIAAVRHNKENMDAVTSRIMALSPGSSHHIWFMLMVLTG